MTIGVTMNFLCDTMKSLNLICTLTIKLMINDNFFLIFSSMQGKKKGGDLNAKTQ